MTTRNFKNIQSSKLVAGLKTVSAAILITSAAVSAEQISLGETYDNALPNLQQSFEGNTPVLASSSANFEFDGIEDLFAKAEAVEDYGEIIDYMSGKLAFEIIDTTIPGDNGMDIVISRSYNLAEATGGVNGVFSSLRTWNFETPRIIIPTVPWGFTRGWQPEQFDDGAIHYTDTTRTGICNDPYTGKGRAYQYGGSGQFAERYWSGMTLKIPGMGAQTLLENTDPDRYPEGTRWVTTSDWIVSCADTENGIGQNAFIVQSPDGKTYTMDILNARFNDYYSNIDTGWQQSTNIVHASKVIDVHGNEITYDWRETRNEDYNLPRRDDFVRTVYALPIRENRLFGISRNDRVAPQSVVIAYGEEDAETIGKSNLISTITVNGDTWTYEYGTGTQALADGRLVLQNLAKVILPDDSYWEYKNEGERMYLTDTGHDSPWYVGGRRITSVKLPSGATIDYFYEEMDTLTHEPYDKVFKLKTKTIKSGTDIVDTWTFKYENGEGSTIKTTVTRGTDVEVTNFHNDKSFKHGQIKKQVLSRTGSTTGRTTEYEYEELAEIGKLTFDGFPRDTPASITRKHKLTQVKVTQDNGTVYTTNFTQHDKFGRPLKQEENGPAGKRLTKYTYFNDESNWIVGLPDKTEVGTREASVDDETGDPIPDDYSVVTDYIYYDQTSEIDEADREEAYEGRGLVYQKSEFGRWVERNTEYDARGNLQRTEFNVALNSPATGNRYVSYSDYKRGKPRTITQPGRYGTGTPGITISQTIDNDGNVTSHTNANGVQTHYKFDGLGRLTSVDYPDETNASFPRVWDDVLYTWSIDDVTKFRERTITRCKLNSDRNACSGDTNFTTTEKYDGLMRLVLTSESDGVMTRNKNFEYNKYHQTTFESIWSGSETETIGTDSEFDVLQRLTKVTTSGLGYIQHNYLSNNRVKVTDQVNVGQREEGSESTNVTTTTYQAYGEPKYEQETLISSPERTTTSIGVNHLGLITGITQSGFYKNSSNQDVPVSSVESRFYDSYSQLCLIRRSDVGNTVFNMNSQGETLWFAEGVSNTACTSTKPASGAVTYTLDNLGEIHEIDYGDSVTDGKVYTLDDNGNVTKIAVGKVESDYVYNNLDLLESESMSIIKENTDTEAEPEKEVELTLDYSYSGLQYRDSVTYPDGMLVKSAPNGFGWPTEAKQYNADNTVLDTFAESATYHHNGIVHTFTYGNDIVHTTTLDPNSRLPTRLRDNTVIDYNYTYDLNGNIKSMLVDNDDENAYSLTSLGYDGLDRLISTTGNSGIGSSSIKYDSLGNIRSYSSKSRSLTYTYNGQNRLSSVSGVSGKYGSIGYDARGNITSNGGNSFTFNLANQIYRAGENAYLYDGNERRVKEIDSKGIHYSLYSQDGILLYRSRQETANSTALITNYIYLGGKLIAKSTDEDSTQTGQTYHRPFGETLQAANDDIGYTGHKFDTELGLSYMQARYYDPIIGRFYSNDPVGYRDVHSFNRYAYANNNPYRYTDPTGMISEGSKKMNRMSEAMFDRTNSEASQELWITYYGVPFRRMDRGMYDERTNTLYLTEIKGFKNQSSIKKAKRRALRKYDPVSQSELNSTMTQQVKDKWMLFSADRSKLKVPRFGNLDLENVNIKVNWAVYEFDKKGSKIERLHTFDMSNFADTWKLYELTFTEN